MMTVRMKIHLRLLIFLQLHQHQYFLDGSVQHVKQPVILEINVEYLLNFSEPLLFWLKFPRIMIHKLLQKLQEIQIGMQLWMKNIVPKWKTTLGILFLFQKEENLSDVNGSTELSMHQIEVLKD